MLLKNKNYIREKFGYSIINQDISLNKIESKEKNNEDQEHDNVCDDLYTTNNIIINKPNTSEYEYSALPSKSSIISNLNGNVNGYKYDNFNKNEPVNRLERKIMIYNINDKREIPFLLYLFEYNAIDNNYNFININVNKNDKIDDIILFILKKININVKYSGHSVYKNENYMFFEFSEKIVEQNNTPYMWALISEIINYKKIYNIEICNEIINLFLNNENIINIYNSNETSIYEIPSVGYSVIDKLEDDRDVLYFNDYDYIFKISNNKEVDTIFIGRYAIFLGIIKLNMRENNKIYKSTHNEYDSVYNINSLTLNEKNVSIKVENKNRFILLSYL